MVAIPLARSTSKRNLLPDIRHRNMYAEASDTDLTDGVVLRERPDLAPYRTVGAGPIRAIVRQAGAFAGDFLVVSGTELWRVPILGTAVLVGTVPGTSYPRISIGKIGTADTALIGNVGALLQTDGVTVTAMAFPDGAAVVDVGYINGYFLGLRDSSGRWYYTDLVTGAFDGTRFVNAERFSDYARRVIVTTDEIWIIGDQSVEIFIPTGIDTADQPPFQRVQGRVFERGTYDAASVQKSDNTVFWLGDDMKAYRGADVPVELPNQGGVVERLALVDFVTSLAFTWRGHKFYILNLGIQGTVALDITTGAWSEWASYTEAKPVSLFRGVCCESLNAVVLIGDGLSNQLFQLTEAFAKDAVSDPLVRTFTAGVAVEGRPLCTSVSLAVSVGTAPAGLNPTIRLRVSDDQGKTWFDCGERSVGRQGEYLTRVRWTRLGQMRAPLRIFEWTITDAAQIRVSDARMNEAA